MSSSYQNAPAMYQPHNWTASSTANNANSHDGSNGVVTSFGLSLLVGAMVIFLFVVLPIYSLRRPGSLRNNNNSNNNLFRNNSSTGNTGSSHGNSAMKDMSIEQRYDNIENCLISKYVLSHDAVCGHVKETGDMPAVSSVIERTGAAQTGTATTMTSTTARNEECGTSTTAATTATTTTPATICPTVPVRFKDRTLTMETIADIESGSSISDGGSGSGDGGTEDSNIVEDNDGPDSVPNAECPICYDELSVGDIVSWSPNPACSHVFHHVCIKEWLLRNQRCPFCREIFLPTDAIQSVSKNGFKQVHALLLAQQQHRSIDSFYCLQHGIVHPKPFHFQLAPPPRNNYLHLHHGKNNSNHTTAAAAAANNMTTTSGTSDFNKGSNITTATTTTTTATMTITIASPTLAEQIQERARTVPSRNELIAMRRQDMRGSDTRTVDEGSDTIIIITSNNNGDDDHENRVNMTESNVVGGNLPSPSHSSVYVISPNNDAGTGTDAGTTDDTTTTSNIPLATTDSPQEEFTNDCKLSLCGYGTICRFTSDGANGTATTIAMEMLNVDLEQQQQQQPMCNVSQNDETGMSLVCVKELDNHGNVNHLPNLEQHTPSNVDETRNSSDCDDVCVVSCVGLEQAPPPPSAATSPSSSSSSSPPLSSA